MASLLSDDETGNRQVQPERPQVSDPRAARAGAGNGEIRKTGKAGRRPPRSCQCRGFRKRRLQGHRPELPHREVYRREMRIASFEEGGQIFEIILVENSCMLVQAFESIFQCVSFNTF